MQKLYHYPLCPFSRQVRITLQEKNLNFEAVIVNYWQKDNDFALINPVMETPVLQDQNHNIADVQAISEYLSENYNERDLLGNDSIKKAKVRAIANWFNNNFYHEVTKHIVNEKLIRFHSSQGAPNSNLIRSAKSNINYHLQYIEYLLKQNKWLAGDFVSFADIAASCHFSVLDYFGDMPWELSQTAKEWYSIIKSRPSFRTLLNDRISGFNPPKSYQDLDF